MAQLNFDATQVAPDEGQMGAIPAGWYNVVMDQSEMKPTKDGSGAYLECRFNVVDGQYAGRKLFARLNIQNANPVAKEIAFRQLSAICHAVSQLNLQDSSQLHNLPMKVKVAVRPATSDYEASNDIKAYKNINEQVGEAAPVAPAAMPPVAPAPVAAPATPAAPVDQAWQQPVAQQPWQAAPAAEPPKWNIAPEPVPAAPVAPEPAPAAPASAQVQSAQAAVPPWQQPTA